MDALKRLFRKPFTTLLWLVFAALMTGFLSAAAALWYSTAKLADTLDKGHTAIAVRSDPGVVIQYFSLGGVTWTTEGRTFTEQDAEAIAAMPGVKAVRSHTLAGGTSPTLQPFFDIRRELSWSAAGNAAPYQNAVFAGRLVAVHDAASNYYTGYEDYDGGTLEMLFELDDVLLLNDEYAEAAETMRYMCGFSYKMRILDVPEVASYFVEGEHYILSGAFMPEWPDWSWSVILNPEFEENKSRRQQPIYFTLDGGSVVRSGEYLESNLDAIAAWGTVPAAERFDGDPKEFFDKTPHDVWRNYRDAWEKQNHALPVIGTERLETMYSFQSGDAFIIDGRSFTEEEYRTGEKVMVISETTAARSNLKIGDTIPFSQFQICDEDVDPYDDGRSRNNPSIGLFQMSRTYNDPEPYTIVGIYRLQALWSKGTYAFTPNTVFIPRSTQIEGAYGSIKPWKATTVVRVDDIVISGESFEIGGQEFILGEGMDPDDAVVIRDVDYELENNGDVYGFYISVELINGKVEDFQLALEQSPYSGQFFAYDQGFEVVQKDLNALSVSTARLSWIALGGWVLLLLLYLLMYQSAQKKNIGIMRSLGAAPKKVTGYLVCSGMAVVLCGILIGTVVSRIVLSVVQEYVLSDMLGAIDRTAYGGALVISEETLSEMVQNSTLTVGASFLSALIQFCVLGAAVWIHAAILSGKQPRKLLEG